MGFVISDGVDNFKDYVRDASIYYSYANSDGFGIASTGEKPILVKYPGSAYDFWETIGKDLDISTNSLIFHCRNKTSGSLDSKSTHPFVDEKTGISISHNGVLYKYDNFKQDLILKGYKFNSEVDSEILLYAYIEYKNDFIKEMKNKGVRGSINLIILDPNDNSVKVYSDDGSFRYVNVGNTIYGASDSNVLRIFGDEDKISSIEPNHMVTFKNGKIIEDIDIGELGEDIKVYGINSLSRYMVPFDYSQYADKKHNKVSFDLSDADIDDFSIDVEGFVKEGNITYSSKWSKALYSNDEDIEYIDDDSHVFIDENGVSFSSESEFLLSAVLITKCKIVKDPKTGNSLNLAKRGLKLLTNRWILDTRDGELYETYDEWKEFSRRRENERKELCQ
ncbi:MAG: class II glutamine amidotransferase [Candidatus Micrarchaeaceae archaeon]